MAKKKQSRCFSGVTYLPFHKVQSLFAEKMKKGVLRSYAYILHDKDLSDSGETKVAHIHFIIRLYSPFTVKSLSTWFSGEYAVDDNGELQNTLLEYCIDRKSMFRYLSHADDPDKYQYSPSDVICSDLRDFSSDDYDDDTAFLALQYMCENVPLYEIARRLGRDFIYHYSSLKQIFNDIKKEK